MKPTQQRVIGSQDGSSDTVSRSLGTQIVPARLKGKAEGAAARRSAASSAQGAGKLLGSAEVFSPDIRLQGLVDEAMLGSFQDQFANVQHGETPLTVEMMTSGGNAEGGRRMALEFRLARESQKRRIVFIGKTTVYSAGVTAMAGFPRADRFLTRDAVLLIHCRQIEREIRLSGPLRAGALRIREVLNEIEAGIEVEHGGFIELIAGSDVSLEEISEKAAIGWYVSAEEALGRGLIAGIL